MEKGTRHMKINVDARARGRTGPQSDISGGAPHAHSTTQAFPQDRDAHFLFPGAVRVEYLLLATISSVMALWRS